MSKYNVTVVNTIELNAPDEDAAVDYATDLMYQANFEDFEVTDVEEVGMEDLED